MKIFGVMTGGAAAVLLAGCVQIQAPDKPIEINLNVNIRQEVVLSLKKDAQDLVTNNPELFPQ
jgi:lipoprotein NlpI